MNVIVIGASGHIGSYLIPTLVRAGHHVVAVSRGTRAPYFSVPEWKEVQAVSCDRNAFLQNPSASCIQRADAVIDTLCMNEADADLLTNAFSQQGTHLCVIGTIWIYRDKYAIPVREDHPATETEPYGREKAKMVQKLLQTAHKRNCRCTVLHPGHISGRGWLPINPQGNVNQTVYQDLSAGREILLPFLGLSTLQFVHAQDLSDLCVCCLNQPDRCDGEVFHATCPDAIPLRSYAVQLSEWFKKTPKIRDVSLETFQRSLSPEDYACSMDHITHSPCCSMQKAEKLLGFVPRFSCIETVKDALTPTDYCPSSGIE